MRSMSPVEAEAAWIIERLLRDCPEGMSEAELQHCYDWIDQARTDQCLLELWEEGCLAIGWGEGGPVFRATEKGRTRCDAA